jgi:ornithine carbamoyltransferase
MLGKDFISLADHEPEDIRDILAVAHYLKRRRVWGIIEHALAGKHLAMVFEKPSLRTRMSFEIGMCELGGRASYLGGEEVGMGRRELPIDVARVLSRYVDGIMVRTFHHAAVRDLASYAAVPVINGLCDHLHPCQALADALTIEEHLGGLSGRRIVFVGDANNVSRSLGRICIQLGASFVLACPAAYAFGAEDIADFGAAWGTTVQQVHDPRAAAAGADILYTDVWTSMGQEREREERLRSFQGYQVNGELLRLAAPDCRVMHCLPAHRGEEITAEVLEGPASIVFDQAENRLHAQKAVLRLLLATDRDAVIAAARRSLPRPAV